MKDLPQNNDPATKKVRWLSLLKKSVVITVFTLVILFFAQNALMFHPNHDPQSWAYIIAQPGFEAVEFSSNGIVYSGILRRNTSGESSPLVIFFYGNADNAARTMRTMHMLNAWPYFRDYNFLVVDYPGFGPLRSGRPSARSLYEMALATFDFSKTLPYISEVIAAGYSIGTGPAVYLAAQRDVSGLILLAPFANGFDLYNSVLPIFHGPLRLLVRNPFPSDQFASTITIPALLVASRHDEVIPFASPERLNKTFAGETTFVILTGVGHTAIMFNQITLDNIKAYLSN